MKKNIVNSKGEEIICKHCGSNDIRLAGIVNNGNQRYKCKVCKKTFTITDRKYSSEFKLEVIKRYLDNHGVRNIEQRMNVSSRMVVYWIQQFGKVLKEALNNLEIPKNLKDVKIIEVDRSRNKDILELLNKSNPKLSELLKEHEKKLNSTNRSKVHYRPNNKEELSVSDIPPEYGLLLMNNKIVLLIFR